MSEDLWSLVYMKGDAHLATFQQTSAPLLLAFGKIPPTMYITDYTAPTMALGYYGDIDEELHVDKCEKYGVSICRRFIGAGHVLYHEGSPTLVAMLNKQSYEKHWSDPETMMKEFIEGIMVGALKLLGAKNVRYVHPGDMKIGERKIGGSSYFYIASLGIYGSGGFVNLRPPKNPELLKEVLNIPPEKFLDKGVSGIEQYVVNASDEAGRKISTRDYIEALAKRLDEVLGVKLEERPLTEDESKALKDTIDKCSKDEFKFLRSSKRRFAKIPKGYGYAKAKFKARKLITADVLIDRNKKIADIMICGDFMVVPPNSADILEQALKGLDATNKELIKSKISEHYHTKGVDYLAISPEDIAKPIIDAIDRALPSVK
ncbi:MAG: hypothetical protein QW261_04760 [Candidatus Jordarchaeaceae archaeon]